VEPDVLRKDVLYLDGTTVAAFGPLPVPIVPATKAAVHKNARALIIVFHLASDNLDTCHTLDTALSTRVP
jgi:hypothetical protein